jgi:phosphatidylglycerol:prolipoprotein diacylglycerol transferase
MAPVLFKWGFITIYTYGVFVALAFLVTTGLIAREARQSRFDESAVYNLCLLLLVSGIAGARFFYVLLNWHEFSDKPLEILMINHGGLVWFGGLIGATVAGFLFIRAKRFSPGEILDLFAPYVALGQAIGRIGCFFNGCCYGIVCPIGFYSAVHHARLFPSQLLDAFTLFYLYVLLQKMKSSRKRVGIIFAWYLMGAGIQRFLLEFLRGDPKPFFGALSVFQWISIGVFAAGVLMRWLLYRRNAS